MVKKNKLTKAETINIIHDRTGFRPAEIGSVINELFAVISEGLAEGRTAEFRGFGTFELKTRKGRAAARNPKTGEKVAVAPHNVAVFRPGQELKEAVWNTEIK